MTDNNISDKVLERIDASAIKPLPRSYFWLWNISMWLLAGVSIVFGGLAVSSLIFRGVNARSTLRPDMPPLPETLQLVPYIWIVLLALFAYLAYREVRSTNRGYKYEFYTIILATILTSVILGAVLYVTGAGFMLDRLAARYVPFHQDLEHIQRGFWQNPDSGFLIGTIDENDEGVIIITDPASIVWQVQFSELVPATKIESLRIGERVGLRGRVLDTDAHSFLACDVRSLEFEGQGLRPVPLNNHLRPINERNSQPARSNDCEDVRPLD